jgi:hypothetical protein
MMAEHDLSRQFPSIEEEASFFGQATAPAV